MLKFIQLHCEVNKRDIIVNVKAIKMLERMKSPRSGNINHYVYITGEDEAIFVSKYKFDDIVNHFKLNTYFQGECSL